MKPTTAPAIPALPAALARWPTYVLHRVAQEALSRFEEAIAPLDIDSRGLSVLVVLAEGGAASQRRLGGLLAIDKSVMVNVVDSLERKALACRAPDPANRRANLVTLTAKGRSVVRRSEQIAEKVNRDFFAEVSPDLRDGLFDALRQLAPREVDAP